ncbi:unnamed protein product [Danaus chrysippus]|uniref:(African queen) hypothetical protein n=1 Tax=Danaus chrysippus TaxID=151541 RepID=A0A8J2QSD1_9NEOP|nr:unnamed protein product [Danaus chrysippus]
MTWFVQSSSLRLSAADRRPLASHSPSSPSAAWAPLTHHYDPCIILVRNTVTCATCIYIVISTSYYMFNTTKSGSVGCTLTTTTTPASPHPPSLPPVSSTLVPLQPVLIASTALVLNCHNQRFYCSMKRERYVFCERCEHSLIP